jgi:hypothetical protein
MELSQPCLLRGATGWLDDSQVTDLNGNKTKEWWYRPGECDTHCLILSLWIYDILPGTCNKGEGEQQVWLAIHTPTTTPYPKDHPTHSP